MRGAAGGRPAGPAGLCLGARGVWFRPDCPAGLIFQARAAGLHQPPQRDSGSARGGHGGRLGGPAALSLRARGLGVRPASPAGLIVESRATGFDQPGRRETSSGRWTAWLSQLGGTHPAGAGLRDSTSRPGGTEPPSTWSTSLPVGTELPGSYGGVRPAGLEGLSLQAGCHGSRPAGPAGLSVLAQAAGVDQPSRRDLASGRGAPPASTAGLSLRALGPPACPSGLSCLARTAGVDQPARRDSASGRGAPPASTARLSLRERFSTRLPGRTEPPGAGRRGRPAGRAGLCLQARGVWFRPDCPAGLIVQARATGSGQTARRETASGRWAAGLSQLGATKPAGAWLRGRPSGPA